jgi:pyruvate/2-oxoglutarate dehydrogenase complex dihydrolipoamide acyltransferase (E2) component
MITADTANDQSFTVNFTLPADGVYYVWLKVWHTSQGDNSVFYDYDGEQLVFDFDEAAGEEDPDYFMYNRWYWVRNCKRGDEPLANGWSEWGEANNQCRHTPVHMNLKAGANSIEFTCREINHFIDQVIITDDPDYDPGDVPGNETYVCGFCNMEHFRKEPFADFGKTPEQYWTERLAAENPAPEPEPEQAPEAAPEPAPEQPAPAPAAPAPTAPQTSDNAALMLVLLLFAASASAFGAAKIRNKA